MQQHDTFLRTIRVEATAVMSLLDHDFTGLSKVIERIINSNAKLFVTGVGKSGIIGKKIAATLSSTGTPSVFLHASEACHGDVGVIRAPDMVLAVSKSGETDEILRLIPFLKHNNIYLMAMTANRKSTLARCADYHLDAHVSEEACPLMLAPTSSSTAALVLGDALAMTLMHARRFNAEDFAVCHPAGHLGRLLLTTVDMVMKTDMLPFAREQTPLQELPLIMSEGRCGLAIIMDAADRVTGIVTDGDLRRTMMQKDLAALHMACARDVMTKNPKIVPGDMLLADAKKIMLKGKITSLLVEQQGRIAGIVQLYDI
ncbi:KpsF/GutQ family sugar-phosphate isomerase [Desulfovibrio sulfodismutans]|uniref:KpsF/GutQ family sugar-phosphate isomerase n=1 Tax=Desulfolutivibrio sulfodismutans TaxID=63561 RepID=A0A7K3NST6_9BACT|nr:KpsF/GutQ family sugar-phosphate isomerase [Desulfolutivibrio sulfodismutans]NDY58883.1 KpsF/GutQ family sugar-phosphate isomerase [Desulfolutivibrio sulfodismutans]QLA12828.1 KpsF/GutQ family sugar-phosphate isomerase [Desulfolutivibrio sulfodismutans DSM 3696]